MELKKEKKKKMGQIERRKSTEPRSKVWADGQSWWAAAGH